MSDHNVAIEALLDKMTKNQRYMDHLDSEIQYHSMEIKAKNELIIGLEKEQETLKEAISKLS